MKKVKKEVKLSIVETAAKIKAARNAKILAALLGQENMLKGLVKP